MPSLSYLFYSLFAGTALLLYLLFFFLTKGWTKRKKQLTVVMLLFVLLQTYYWNTEFNHFLRSYTFPSLTFRCAELKIPLPSRTVFQGMSDHCSPFYRTYIEEKQFVSFYQEELATLKNTLVISDYHPLPSSPGFLIQYGKGSIRIEYKQMDSHFSRIAIKYLPKP